MMDSERTSDEWDRTGTSRPTRILDSVRMDLRIWLADMRILGYKYKYSIFQYVLVMHPICRPITLKQSCILRHLV